jgi:hypothetical protein
MDDEHKKNTASISEGIKKDTSKAEKKLRLRPPCGIGAVSGLPMASQDAQ